MQVNRCDPEILNCRFDVRAPWMDKPEPFVRDPFLRGGVPRVPPLQVHGKGYHFRQMLLRKSEGFNFLFRNC